MSKAYLSIITILILVIVLQIVISPSPEYVCPDGSIETDFTRCELPPMASINVQRAESAVQNYGVAQAGARGDQFTRVNVYRQEGDFFAQTLFTNRNTGSVSEVKFKIDGRTAIVTCYEGCQYLSTENESQTI